MVAIPLMHKLKRRMHRGIALAQDNMVMEIYNSFPDAILHGGTAIWRCFGSWRFSEDIDVYLPKRIRKSENINLFLENLEKKGFVKIKFREKLNSIFSVFSFQNSVVRFEAVFENKKNFIAKPFEMSDGTFINVYTFSAEELIKEKISAYSKRKKVRDLYDIYFLLKFIENKNEIKSFLKDFIEKFNEPKDAKELKVLIITGAVPTVKSMLEEIKRWVR